ncbi:hypothetical protein KBD20_02950 [Candidatus Saccharibacteria bacterium]|nr:hypothetical protein [Candidatus Saccharibacteria bacterium]
MSGENQTISLASGPITAATGVAMLPSTSGNTLMTALSIVLIAGGALILGSFIVTKVASRFMR